MKTQKNENNGAKKVTKKKVVAEKPKTAALMTSQRTHTGG